MGLICPVCNADLVRNGNCYQCSHRHSFDVAKSGYVNLLMSQKSKEKRHGDDKKMVWARRNFLQKGYYNCLAQALCELADKHYTGGTLLDAGCGECWYTQQIMHRLTARVADIIAIDISKNALDLACKQSNDITCAVASVFDIPVASQSCGMVMNIFAPFSHAEYNRVLQKNGVLLLAVPLERHLFGLKQVVYDRPYENATTSHVYDGFALLENMQIKRQLHLTTQEDILNLFMMTPYYYKTGRKDFEKLQSLKELQTELEFGLYVFQKL